MSDDQAAERLKWGVFDRRDCFDKTVHVCPVQPGSDMIAAGHRILLCQCQPRQERYGEFVLVIHRQES